MDTERPFCDVHHIGLAGVSLCYLSERAGIEGDGMRKLANLTVAAAMVLAASSQFALGGDKRPKQSGSAGCVQLSYGCLTCADGPCVIKTRPGNPITISTGSATTGGSSANLPKPKVSETKR
jgi:hypothetical protein